jgi:GT2 family glycosyltransferase
MSSVGAVIVTWNSAGEIERCVAAVRQAGVAEVVVVDNGSSDATREIVARLNGVKLLHFPENLGFAGGVNRGVAALDTEYVLILNPDCEVEAGLAEMAREAGTGACGGLLLDSAGAPQKGFFVRRLPTPATLIFETLGLNRLSPNNRINRRYRCLDFDPSRAQEVEQPPGAFLMVFRATFLALGGMDEGFWPVWFEDVDWCARLRAAGYPVRYTPLARARHQGGASIRKIHWPFKELAWYGSLLRYATKHFGWSSRLVGLAVAVASVPRSITGIFLRRQGFRALGVYARVFMIAFRSLVTGRVDIRRFGRQLEGADQLENA